VGYWGIRNDVLNLKITTIPLVIALLQHDFDDEIATRLVGNVTTLH
jgi:hypothetical protein